MTEEYGRVRCGSAGVAGHAVPRLLGLPLSRSTVLVTAESAALISDSRSGYETKRVVFEAVVEVADVLFAHRAAPFSHP